MSYMAILRRLPPSSRLGNLPQVAGSNIPSSRKGNILTAKFMREVARKRAGHPLVQRLARNILIQYGVPSNHYVTEALAIGDFVKKNVRYVRDPSGIEQLTDPILMIEEASTYTAQGDCDDMSLLVATLLLSIGHNPSFRMIRYQGSSGPFDHIYVVDYEKNPGEQTRRIVLDAIMKDEPIGYEIPHASGEELAV